MKATRNGNKGKATQEDLPCAEEEATGLPVKRRSGEKIGEPVRLRAIELLQDGRSNEQVNDTLRRENLLARDDNIGRATFTALRRESRKGNLRFTDEGVQVGEWALSQGLVGASSLIECAMKELVMPSGRMRLSLGAPMITALFRVFEGSTKLLLVSLASDKSEPLLAYIRVMQAELKKVEEDPAITIMERARIVRELQIWQTERLLNLHNLMKSGGKMPTLEELAAAGFKRTPENEVSRAADALAKAEKSVAGA